MGWRSETFIEVGDKIKQALPTIESVALFNNQQDAWKGSDNDESPLSFPCVLWEFSPADCEYKNLLRIYPEHEFRAHLIQESYLSEHTNEPSALEHLDLIEDLANALHRQAYTHVSNLEFIGYELDENRTNLTVHILKFRGKVVDDSYQIANQLPTKQPTQKQIIVTTNPVEIDAWKNQNNIP